MDPVGRGGYAMVHGEGVAEVLAFFYIRKIPSFAICNAYSDDGELLSFFSKRHAIRVGMKGKVRCKGSIRRFFRYGSI